MSESTVPEILRCNLAAVLLQIMAMGIKDVHKFDFMNKPGPGVLILWLGYLGFGTKRLANNY